MPRRAATSGAPLSGVRVLDVSAQLPGPFASLLLGDMGASVVKVERPGGDPARALAPIFLGVGRGKRSVVLDLRRREGAALVRRLAARSDVFLEGFRPGALDRLGLGYAALRRRNRALVYVSISGYGRTGPYRDRPGHDVNYLAACGAFDPADPRVPPLPVADLAAGTFAALAVTGALLRARATGRGAHIDLAMSDAVLCFMATRLNPERMPAPGRDLASLVPCYGVFATRDGRHLALGIAHEDEFWRRLCRRAGLGDLAALDAAARMARRDEVRARLATLFRRRTLARWLRALPPDEIPVTPVRTIDEARADPHHRARGSIFRQGGLWQAASPWPRRREPSPPPPRAGEHTREVLREAGLGDAEIDALVASGVAAEADRRAATAAARGTPARGRRGAAA